MLLILADVYRIATLRAADPPLPERRNLRQRESRLRRWFSIAGLKL